MANGITMQSIDKLAVSDEIKRQLKFLKQAPVLYNNVGLLPSEASWYIPKDTMEQLIEKTAKEYLGAKEVRMVGIEPVNRDQRNQQWPYVTLWLPANSRHLYENVGTAGKTNDPLAMSVQVNKYSRELIDFCDQYAPTHDRRTGREIKRSKRIVIIKPSKESPRGMIGIDLDLKAFMMRSFDAKNKGFIDVWGNDLGVRSVNVHCSVIYKGHENEKIIAIRVTKKYAGDGERLRTPVRAYSDR